MEGHLRAVEDAQVWILNRRRTKFDGKARSRRSVKTWNFTKGPSPHFGLAIQQLWVNVRQMGIDERTQLWRPPISIELCFIQHHVAAAVLLPMAEVPRAESGTSKATSMCPSGPELELAQHGAFKV